MKPVVIKRDGCRAPFNGQLIAEAVCRAAEAVNQANPALAERISSAVSQELEGRGEVDIHEIQNRVENHLMASDDKAIARAYIEYRHDRDQAREARGRLAQEIRGLVEQTNALLGELAARLPALRHIAGHEDLDRERVPASDDPAVQVHRKLDPGPRFPWTRVLSEVPLQRVLPL